VKGGPRHLGSEGNRGAIGLDVTPVHRQASLPDTRIPHVTCQRDSVLSHWLSLAATYLGSRERAGNAAESRKNSRKHEIPYFPLADNRTLF
jgi:hypothetical protein